MDFTGTLAEGAGSAGFFAIGSGAGTGAGAGSTTAGASRTGDDRRASRLHISRTRNIPTAAMTRVAFGHDPKKFIVPILVILTFRLRMPILSWSDKKATHPA